MTFLTQRRLNPGDYKGAGPWFPAFISLLNLREEDLLGLINGNLTIGDNLAGQIITLSFSTPSDYATGGFPRVAFNYSGLNRPSVVLLGSITCTKPGGAILSPTSLQWSYNNGVNPAQVVVTYVAGLTASQSYSATFLVL